MVALLTAFPTVIFAALAALCLAYWGLVLLGAADIDALDSLAGHGHGGVEGVAASVKGLAGAVKGVAGAAKGGGSVLGHALAFLGLSRVPITISLSTFSLTGFLLSVLSRGALDAVVPGAVSALVALAVATAGGVGVTAVAARALGRLFVDGRVEQGGDSLVGKTCTITIAADDTGGQARADGDVIVSVRAVGTRLGEGEEALITDRADDGVFVVEPLRAHLPAMQDAFASLDVPATANTHAPAPQDSSRDAVVAAAVPRKDNA